MTQVSQESRAPPVIWSCDVLYVVTVFFVIDFLLTKANHGLNVLDNVANAFSLYNNDPSGKDIICDML